MHLASSLSRVSFGAFAAERRSSGNITRYCEGKWQL
jgi:hypothetical protein